MKMRPGKSAGYEAESVDDGRGKGGSCGQYSPEQLSRSGDQRGAGFYYTSSVEGKQLAKRLQERLVKGLDPQNHRQAKANDSYYLLKKQHALSSLWSADF